LGGPPGGGLVLGSGKGLFSFIFTFLGGGNFYLGPSSLGSWWLGLSSGLRFVFHFGGVGFWVFFVVGLVFFLFSLGGGSFFLLLGWGVGWGGCFLVVGFLFMLGVCFYWGFWFVGLLGCLIALFSSFSGLAFFFFGGALSFLKGLHMELCTLRPRYVTHGVEFPRWFFLAKSLFSFMLSITSPHFSLSGS